MAFLNVANEARRPAVARCGLVKGTDGVRSAGGGRFRLGDMPATTASRRRSARRQHKTQGAGGLAIEHHRPLPGLHAGLRVCPCALLRCRRSGRWFGTVAVVVVAVLIAVGCWLLVTPAPHLRHNCATPAPPPAPRGRNPCATPAQPLRHPCATPAPHFAPHAAPPRFFLCGPPSGKRPSRPKPKGNGQLSRTMSRTRRSLAAVPGQRAHGGGCKKDDINTPNLFPALTTREINLSRQKNTRVQFLPAGNETKKNPALTRRFLMARARIIFFWRYSKDQGTTGISALNLCPGKAGITAPSRAPGS